MKENIRMTPKTSVVYYKRARDETMAIGIERPG